MRHFLLSSLKEARTITFFLFLFIANSVVGQTATLTTDAEDYPPGSTVTLTGSGFSAGETVTLHVVHADDDPDGTDPQYHEPWTAIADANGNFVTTWWVPDDGDAAGASLKATADGETSGLHAEAFFTDNQLGNNAVSVGSQTLAFGTG